MPVFTTTVSNQNTATSAGVYSYPQLGQIKQNSTIQEQWSRLTLLPTNSYTLYTESKTGSGTDDTTTNLGFLTMATSTSTSDLNDVYVSGALISRLSRIIYNRSAIHLQLIFSCQDTTNINNFIGLYLSSSALSAVPSTASHMGILMNPTNNANFVLSSSDGTTQTTTDTGRAIDNKLYLLDILWNGNNSATISLYGPHVSGQDFLNNLIKTQTVTALHSSGDQPFLPYVLHFFVQTTTTAARVLKVGEWILTCT